MYIDHNERQNHFFERDLVDSATAFLKMSGRVDMGAPLPDMRENLREKPVSQHSRPLVVPIDRLTLFIWKTRPVREAGRKSMR